MTYPQQNPYGQQPGGQQQGYPQAGFQQPGQPGQFGFPSGGYQPPRPNSNKKAWIIVAIVVALVLAGGITAIVLLTKGNGSTAAAGSSTTNGSSSQQGSNAGNSDPKAVGQKLVDSLSHKNVDEFVSIACAAGKNDARQSPLVGSDAQVTATLVDVQVNGNSGTIIYTATGTMGGSPVPSGQLQFPLTKENGGWCIPPSNNSSNSNSGN